MTHRSDEKDYKNRPLDRVWTGPSTRCTKEMDGGKKKGPEVYPLLLKRMGTTYRGTITLRFLRACAFYERPRPTFRPNRDKV